MPVSNRQEQKTRNAFLEDWRETEERAVVSLLYSVVVGTTDENGEATPQSKTVMLDFINQTGGKNPFSALHGGRDHSAIWTALASLAVNEAVIAIDTQNLMERLQATDWTAKDINALLDCSDQIRYGTASFKTYVDALQDFKNRQKIADQAAELARNAINRSLPLENWIAPVKQAVTQAEQKNNAPRYKAIPALEFCEKYKEAPQKLFSWARRGDYALIHAPTGVGKTWFALSHAVSLATGKGRACGLWEPCCEPQKVICVDGEMSGYDMRSRLFMLAEMHGTTIEEISKNLHILSWKDYNVRLPNPDLQSYLAWECQKNNVAMVVLDNYGSIFPVEDENKAAEFENKVFPVIQDLCRNGACVPLIHHSRKAAPGEKDDPSYAGTSAMARHATVNIALRKPRKNAAQYGDFEIIFQKDRNAVGVDGRATVDRDENGRLVWTNGGLISQADLIRDALEEYPDKTPREIASLLGLSSDHHVYNVMRQEKKRKK